MYLIKVMSDWWWQKILPVIIVVNLLVTTIVYFTLIGDFAIPVIRTSCTTTVCLFTKSQCEAESLTNLRRIYCRVGIGVDILVTDIKRSYMKSKDGEFIVFAKVTITVKEFHNLRGDSFYRTVNKSILRKSFDIMLKRKMGNENSCNWKSVLESFGTTFVDYHFIDE
jgi:hypothetical protein